MIPSSLIERLTAAHHPNFITTHTIRLQTAYIGFQSHSFFLPISHIRNCEKHGYNPEIYSACTWDLLSSLEKLGCFLSVQVCSRGILEQAVLQSKSNPLMSSYLTELGSIDHPFFAIVQKLQPFLNISLILRRQKDTGEARTTSSSFDT